MKSQSFTKSRSQQHSVVQAASKPLMKNPQSSKKQCSPVSVIPVQNFSTQQTSNSALILSQKEQPMNTVQQQSKKEMLENFINCNNSQLFQHPQIDFKSFIRKNYQTFNLLLQQLNQVNQEIESKNLELHQIESQGNLKINQNEEKENLNPGQISIIDKRIQEKEQSKQELQTTLAQLVNMSKKKDYLEEYQECCKNLQILREQNSKLCQLINKQK